MSSMYKINHAPALIVRLHNRRVIGRKQTDGTVSFEFKRLVGREIYKERIRLSQEAVVAMVSIMGKFGLIGGMK